jgi:uncharacterized protein YcgI (DUF1989 family)
MIEQFDIPRGTGRAFTVDRGRLVRLVQLEGGGQVADLIVFNRSNPAERFWPAKTAWDYGTNISVGAALLSTGPSEEPLMTIVADSLPREPTPKGARYHDVMLACCSRKSHMRKYGAQMSEPGCWDMLSEAVAPYGIPGHHVDATLNGFMLTGFADGKAFHEPSLAAEGDYVELRADKDLIVAISSCQGRSSKPGSKGLRIQVR